MRITTLAIPMADTKRPERILQTLVVLILAPSGALE